MRRGESREAALPADPLFWIPAGMRKQREPRARMMVPFRCDSLGRLESAAQLCRSSPERQSLHVQAACLLLVHLGSDATTRAGACSVARATAARACRRCADRPTGKRFSECRSTWLGGSLGSAGSDAAEIPGIKVHAWKVLAGSAANVG